MCDNKPAATVQCIIKYAPWTEEDGTKIEGSQLEVAEPYYEGADPFRAKIAAVKQVLEGTPGDCVECWHYDAKANVFFVEFDNNYERFDVFANDYDVADRELFSILVRIEERLDDNATMLFTWPNTKKPEDALRVDITGICARDSESDNS